MDEVWVRVAVLVGVLAVAAGTAAGLRWRRRRPVRPIEVAGLRAGVYFFSSASCATCATARATLDARLGESGYTEFAWEDDASVFTSLEVDAVPAVVVLDEAGRGKLYAGQPDRVLARLDP
jgi:hypothetical protein